MRRDGQNIIIYKKLPQKNMLPADMIAVTSYPYIKPTCAAHPMQSRLIRNMSMTTVLKWLWQL